VEGRERKHEPNKREKRKEKQNGREQCGQGNKDVTVGEIRVRNEWRALFLISFAFHYNEVERKRE